MRRNNQRMATAGTYRLSVGKFFYIGSTTDMRRRKADHQWRLRRAIHPAKRMQKEFSKSGIATFTPLEFIRQGKDESERDFTNRLKSAEQLLLDELMSDPNIENKSRNSKGPDNGEIIKAKWQDPEFRQIMTNHLSRIAQIPKTPETREKMAAAKRGANNPKSRAVIVTRPDGTSERFESGSDAAKFFNVSQQLFDQWMKGISAWPGTGRITRRQNLWIVGHSARLEVM